MKFSLRGISNTVSEGIIKTGDLVIVRRGKHTGAQFVVVRAEKDAAYIADGVFYKGDKPRRKTSFIFRKHILVSKTWLIVLFVVNLWTTVG